MWKETSLLFIAPPRGQSSPNVMSVPMMMYWLYVLSLVMICQRAAEKFAYFLFSSFTVKFDWLNRQAVQNRQAVLNMENLLKNFVKQDYLKIICAKFWEDLW